MILSTSVFIGLRYTRAKRRHQFISFVSIFSLLGMALGTLALILVLSVMNGFDREIKQRILSVVPHGFVDQLPRMPHWQKTASVIQTTPNLVASAPYIGAFVMLGAKSGVHGVELQGILPERESQVSNINRYILPPQQLKSLKAGEFGIVLGRLVARYLNVDIGDKIVMTLPQVSVTPAGLFPRVKRFTVVGLFEVGAQVDQSLALIHLNDAQRLFQYGSAVQGLRLQTDNIYRAASVIQELSKELGENYELRDWSQTQGSLFQAIKMEKRMVTLLLMIIIAVAALNIVTSLVLMVSDKRSDIAVLRTLGMTTKHIMSIFIVQGSVVGVVGIVIGGVVGCLLALNISDLVSWFESVLGLYVFDPNVYFISQIPSELRISDVLLICGVGIVLSVLATLYPAYRATQVEPAEVLRYE
ncbi:MAG: lipoprotein-releasing system permease protein [Cellvibrionaceae bacterium]|jgi:lipoprotein-releasing system permease protein